MMFTPDMAVRMAAFHRLQQLEKLHGPILPWEIIAEGFLFEGKRLRFANRARGIFRPSSMASAEEPAALSIKSVVPREGREQRYDDLFSYSGTLLYHFQGTNPDAWDNRLLKAAFEQQVPLIYFCGVSPGEYQPVWPVYISELDIERLRCEVRAGELPTLPNVTVRPGERPASWPPPPFEQLGELDIERRYATRQVQQRLHQARFRVEVLAAYKDRCAICRLPAKALLEAAHIIPDRETHGHAEVPNGLALCRLHHGAFDAELLGIRPDYVIELAPQLLAAHDGPTLEQGLKSFHLKPLPQRPTRRADWPKPDYLEQRYHGFLSAQQRLR